MQVGPSLDGRHGPRLDAVALRRTVARLISAGATPWLHQEAARRMAERLPLVKLQPATVLDWSGPLGGGEELLRRVYPRAEPWKVVLDALPDPPVTPRPRWPWRRAAPRRKTVRECEVVDGGAQLVWANMMLQGFEDPAAVFGRWQRALAVGGFLMFSTLGPGTLPELRFAYRAAGWGEPQASLLDMHDLGDMLVHAGFADPVMDQELLTLTWADGNAMLRELRGLGANLAPGRHRGCRTPRWRERLVEALCAHAADGRPRLSFELVYGHAFKAAPRARVQAQTTLSVDALRAMARAGKPPSA
jgi:malonyl-CoA O-methyltransferase